MAVVARVIFSETMMVLDNLGSELLGSLLEMASTMEEEAQNSLQKERLNLRILSI